MVQTYKRKRLL